MFYRNIIVANTERNKELAISGEPEIKKNIFFDNDIFILDDAVKINENTNYTNKKHQENKNSLENKNVLETLIIIGMGTLGSNLAEVISKIPQVKKIILYDKDIIEEKNLKNSIFKEKCYIGLYKANIVKQIIQKEKPDLEIESRVEFFTDFLETNKKDSDFIIDCTDKAYSRSNKIDMKCYIGSNKLCLDFRPYVNYDINNSQSKSCNEYLVNNNIKEIRKIFKDIFSDKKKLTVLKKSEKYYYFILNNKLEIELKRFTKKSDPIIIEKESEKKSNLIKKENSMKLKINYLKDKSQEIIKVNKNNKLKAIIKILPEISLDIDIKMFNNPYDIENTLVKFISQQNIEKFNYYEIQNSNLEKNIINLYPETFMA